MPRYFLNLLEDGKLYEDPDGDEWADDQAARDQALLNARAILKDRPISVSGWLRLVYEIRDESGRLVDRVPFAAAIDTEWSR
jgi:hypothetical protein